MVRRDIRRRCRSLVREIALPRPFSALALSASLAGQRGRPLYLQPLPEIPGGPGKPCGMWLATDVADHIFYETQTSRFHQNHIILHELSHIICGHIVPGIAGHLPRIVTGQPVDVDLVRNALLRTSYSTSQEQEAELVATMLLGRAMKLERVPTSERDRWLGTTLGFLDGR